MIDEKVEKEVEALIKRNNGLYTKEDLYKYGLASKGMVIKDYRAVITKFKKLGKIIILENYNVVWVYYPEIYNRLIKISRPLSLLSRK